MSNKVTLSTPADMLAQVSPRPAGAEIHAPKPAITDSATATAADLRLIIEETEGGGHYVYTVVDRRTGDIISQLPREEVLRMKDQPDYAAGDLFKGEA